MPSERIENYTRQKADLISLKEKRNRQFKALIKHSAILVFFIALSVLHFATKSPFFGVMSLLVGVMPLVYVSSDVEGIADINRRIKAIARDLGEETERQEERERSRAKKRVIIFSLLSLFAVGLFAAAIIISGMGLTENQLRGISGEYKKAVQELCNKYGLTDAEIKIGENFTTRSRIGNSWFYTESATIKSDSFKRLSAENAFLFMRDFDSLDNDKYLYKDNRVHVIFSTSLKTSAGEVYYYNSQYSDLTGAYIEYLMRGGSAAVTYKDGELIYNNFHQ